jgi:glycosyltransferase involved in cell wall biosynthesis
MKILCIANLFPLPVDRGHAIRELGFLKALAAVHEIHVLTLERLDTGEDLVSDLETLLGARVEAFPHAPPGQPTKRAVALRWARSLLRGMPPWVLAESSVELLHRARVLAPQFDRVFLMDDYSFAYAGALKGDTPIIGDKNSVLGSLLGPHRRVPGSWREQARHTLGLSLTRRFERRTAQHVDVVVATTHQEARRFNQLYGRLPEAIVPSAVDLPPATSRREGCRAVGWLGHMGYTPNTDGLVDFVQAGWAPMGGNGYKLLIAGAGEVPPQVRNLERFPGVEVLGYVDEVDQFLARLGAAVVPLWWGAGVKLKTLTLMGAGIPTVATPVALEGIEAEHGRHCLIADDPQQLSSALHSVLADQVLARRLRTEGRRIVRERHTWDTVGPQLTAVVESAAGGGAR